MLSEKIVTRLLWIVGALYTLLYLAFFPPITTTMDESAYLDFAYVLRQGTFYGDTVHVTLPMYIEAAGHTTIKYPPGMSLYLAVLSFLGWKVALGANLFVHLITFGVVARLLKLVGGSPLYAIFYLLHPTAIIYSRTVMSDPLGGLLVSLAFLAYVTKRPFLVGVLLGMAILIKTANALVLGFFFLGAILDSGLLAKNSSIPSTQGDTPKKWQPALSLMAGGAPWMLLAYAYQKIVQEGGWAKYGGVGQFTPNFFIHHFPFYFLALLLVFPGMLIGLCLYRGPGRWPMVLSAAGIICFYSAYYYLDQTGSKLESFIIGQRFLLAVLPLMVVGYGTWLTKLIPESIERRVLPLIALLLLAMAGLIGLRHQNNLKKLARIREAIMTAVPQNSTLACTVHVGKLLHPGWGGERPYIFLSDDQTLKPTLTLLRQKVAQGPTFFALWSREYRQDAGGDQKLLQEIDAQFRTRLVPTGIEGLVLEELTAEK